MTMTLISTVTLATANSSIGFVSIPQTYKDLKIVYSTRTSVVTTEIAVYFFISGGGTYSARRLVGTGSSALSNTSTTAEWLLSQGTNSTANTFSNVEIYLPNYTSALDKSLSVDAVIENNASLVYNFIGAGLVTSTIGITDCTLALGVGTFVAGSTASLYGISTTGATGATVA